MIIQASHFEGDHLEENALIVHDIPHFWVLVEIIAYFFGIISVIIQLILASLTNYKDYKQDDEHKKDSLKNIDEKKDDKKEDDKEA